MFLRAHHVHKCLPFVALQSTSWLVVTGSFAHRVSRVLGGGLIVRRSREGFTCLFPNLPRTEGWDKVQGKIRGRPQIPEWKTCGDLEEVPRKFAFYGNLPRKPPKRYPDTATAFSSFLSWACTCAHHPSCLSPLLWEAEAREMGIKRLRTASLHRSH